MDGDTFILLLRVTFLSLLYIFIFSVAIAGYRQLRITSISSQSVTHDNRQPRLEPIGNLVVIEEGESGLIAGQSYELSPVTSMGRNLGNTIVIPDSFASGEHAVLAWKQQSWWIKDTGSTNGTLLNRQIVEKPTKVKSGDLIQIGRVKLKIVLEETH